MTLRKRRLARRCADGKRLHRRRRIILTTVIRTEVVATFPRLFDYAEHRREELGLTGKDVAKRMGLSALHYSQLWRDQKTIQEGVLVDLERALEVDRSYWTSNVKFPKRLSASDVAVISRRERIRRLRENLEKSLQVTV